MHGRRQTYENHGPAPEMEDPALQEGPLYGLREAPRGLSILPGLQALRYEAQGAGPQKAGLLDLEIGQPGAASSLVGQ